MTVPDRPAQHDVLVVDDERPALEDLAYLLRDHPAVRSVSLAVDANEALRAIGAGRFGAVFLDIHMPGLDGLELARLIGRMDPPPGIIFVTAYESHAVEAFELRALDYLLKPVRAERLAEAMLRLDGGAGGADDGSRIGVELAGRTRFIDRGTVRFVEASGDYVRLHSEEGAFLFRSTISTLEERWRRAGFVRIHRRYLVALRHLSELRPKPEGGWVVVVDGGQELPVSRRQASELRDELRLRRP